ncbi:VIT-domain-containing protein [Marasmius fiardii PR-910]|nr:VIT-domain-containing protein [Marasmius fiardii PR-910]
MFSSSNPPICRLFCPNHTSSNNNFVLDSCSVSVIIADVHASVQLSQRFRNPSDTLSLDAVYTFGLCADAAVCGFQMIRADGTKVEGVVKEKEEAKKEFQEAVNQGYTASLGSEETKDIFSISVGNISPSEVVTINLRYLQTLKDDEKRDQVRFTFPRTYAQRYGQAPAWNAQTASTAHQPFVLDAVIQQSGSIKTVSCPSGHPMDLELGKSEDFVVDESASDSHFAKVTLRDGSGYLTQDVILVVTATGLDSPRCFIEAHPSPEHDTVAMGLTFVPRFKLPDVLNGMEYIFLVDRSGSMEGTSIKLVREALVVLLRGLPTKGTTFNIFSFGSNVTKLWDSSQSYTQSSLEAATQHVDSMLANYGGTEIAAALSSVYSSLPKPLARPASIFLLTDGSAWDISSCVKNTREALSTFATPENFIRVFSLGIGDGASTDTCDSIAIAGQGFSVFVAANEPVMGKCARLVRAARTPPIRDLEVLWTGKENNIESEASDDDDFEMVENDAATAKDVPQTSTKRSTPISLFDDSDNLMNMDTDVGPPPKPEVTLPPTPRIQEAPQNITSIFPGTRLQIYAIISNKQISIPSSIKVRGTVATTGSIVELEVTVTRIARSQQQGQRNHTILHTIAAKALIADREKDKHVFPQSISSSFANNDELRDAYLKEDIVRLGTTYGLTSRHTSFIAVDRRTGQSLPQEEKHGFANRHGEGRSGDLLRGLGAPRLRSVARAIPASYDYSTISSLVSVADRSSLPRSVRSGGVHASTGSSRHVASRDSASPVEFRLPPAPPPAPRPSASMSARRRAPPPPPPQAPTARSPVSPKLFGAPAMPIEEKGERERDRDRDLLRMDPDVGGAPQPQVEAAPPPRAVRRGRPMRVQAVDSSAPPTSPPSSSAPSAMTEGERLAAIARLQQFDGGFTLTQDLLRLLKVELTIDAFKQKCAGESDNDDIIVTALALLWLEKHGSDDSLELQEKAKQWLMDNLGDEEKVAGTKEKTEKLFTL